MKQAFVLAMLVVVFVTLETFSASAADVQVPEAVKKAFAEKHPDVTDGKWGEEKEGGKTNYEVAWTDKSGVKHEIEFDAAGTAVLVADGVKVADLPKEVTAAVAKAYAGSEISEAMHETKGKDTLYEVTIKDKAGKKVVLDVTPDGSKVTEDKD